MDRLKSTYEGLLIECNRWLQICTSSTSSQAQRTKATRELEAAVRDSDDACLALQTQLAAAERHIHMQKIMGSMK
ncbi:g5663 [Coccomyxa elongata]